MRLLLLTTCLPAWALAEDFVLPTDVTAATVYASGAEIVRSASVDLPAGTHRILMPLPPTEGMIGAPRLAASGVTLGMVSEVSALPLAARDLLTDEQRAADDAVTAAAAALNEARDAAARIEGDLRAAEARLAFLETVAFPTEFEAGADVGATLASMADTIAAQTAAATAQIVRLRAELREAREDLEEAEAEAARARRVLEELGPLGESPAGLVATVTVPAATASTIEVTYLTGGASWEPEYEMRLDTRAQTLELTRLAALRQFTGETWTDVALTLSTADPGRGAEPAEVRPAPAVIAEDRPVPVPVAPTARGMAVEETESFAADIMVAPEPVVVAQAASYGLSLRYAYPERARVTGGGERTVLTLGMLDLEPELTNVAAPRFDQTAYLMAEAENESGETLLPGDAAIYRDGDFVGRTRMGQWAEGDVREIAFGPVETIRLDWQVLRRMEGDAGVFTRKGTREVRARVTVENTGAEEAQVRVLYALPFSEQEDLEVTVSAEPRPAERDVDGLRGVSAWELAVPAGGEAEISLFFDLDWPEGQILLWQP